MSSVIRSIFLAGPTAVGKSDVALALAEKLDGEIISVDSMQVYRGMNIGTAKPSASDRTRIRHHLLDVVDLTQTFDAGTFVQLAREAERGILSRGKVAIYCGGTGLYFQALVEGLDRIPGFDPELRAALEGTSISQLLEELHDKDFSTWTTIDRQNPRRVVRAVEILRLQSRLDTHPSSTPTTPPGNPPTAAFFLNRPADALRARQATRVKQMLEAGLIQETQALVHQGLRNNRTAQQAIGYRQILEYLDGARRLEETKELIRSRTWQYARRQLTWWRAQPMWRWLELANDAATSDICELIAELPSMSTPVNLDPEK